MTQKNADVASEEIISGNKNVSEIEGNKEYIDLLEKIKNTVEKKEEVSNNENTEIFDSKEIKKELDNKQDVEVPFNLEKKSADDYYKNVVLEVLDLKKKISFKTIVENITFDMKAGEIIGLLGPNGSGKTTIMRMMVGLTKATSGEVYCLERTLGLGNTKMLKEVGVMIESPEFYNYMSGYSNLKQLVRLSNKKIKRSKIKEVLNFVGLDKVARKSVKTYSLGMRQRLGLAQALIHDPKILILDEPVNGLDPQGVQDFRNKLKEIASTGVSILISSHLLDEIEKVADRVIVLEKGKIIYNDTLDSLRSDDVLKTVINTYDNNRAKELLKDLEIDYVLEEKGFVFYDITKEQKSQIIAYLVNNYVEIDYVEILQKTLEESFLELTSKGGNE